MFKIDLNKIKEEFYNNVMGNIEIYLPKIIGALIVIALGIIISIGIYKLVIFLFKKFKITELVDKLNIDFDSVKKGKKKEKIEENEIEIPPVHIKISDKIKIDKITAKASAYYIFLVFFRFSIVIIGIKEIEDFMSELLKYLPSLFVGILIGFFGIRFANFIYDLVFHTLDLTKQKTAKIIASSARIIILFFTLMVVLGKIGIANDITSAILIGFISMLAIAGGLAFGLGGKEIAHEILESLKK